VVKRNGVYRSGVENEREKEGVEEREGWRREQLGSRGVGE